MICYIIHYTKLIERKNYLLKNIIPYLEKSKYIKEIRWITEFDKEHPIINEIKKNTKINPSEISCSKKHYFTWNLFNKSNYDKCLIIEDDVFLVNPETFVKNFDNMVENIKDDYYFTIFNLNEKFKGDNNTFYKKQTTNTTLSYIINKKFIDYFKQEKYDLPIDHTINKILKDNNINSYWYKPDLIKHTHVLKSSINHTNISKNNILKLNKY